MNVKIAKVAGYCFGIERAMNLVNQVIEESNGDPIYTLGDLSHNKQEMQRLRQAGVYKVDAVEEADKGYLIVRTHGVSKEEIQKAKEKGLKIIDATCPFVKKIHEKIEAYDRQGYQIVIIGDRAHPEVQGACGWAEREPIILNSVREAEALDDNYDKICIVAQTTSIKEKFDAIVEVLRKKTLGILIFNTICHATADRQKAAAELAERVDGMVVVGGYHSSNTQKLKQVCEAHCTNTWHVETAAELDMEAIKKLPTVGITAGASTPGWLIEEVTERMEDNKFEQEVVVEEESALNSETEALEQTEVETEDNVADEAVATEAEDTQDIDIQAAESEVENAEETEELLETVVEPVSEDVAEEISEAEEELEETIEEAKESAEEERPTPSVIDDYVQMSPEDNAASDAEFDFAAEIDNLKPVRKNTPIEGEVLSVSDDEVILNIGYKSDAVIYKRDFTWRRDEELEDLVKIGDKVTAIVTDLNDGDGRVKLSKIKYDNQKIQERLGRAYENREILYGKIRRVSGSGLIVDIGFAEIFMPASQYHLHFVKDLESLVGNDVRGVIIDYNAKRRRAILSQKVLLQEERRQRQREQQAIKERRFNELEIGDEIEGHVKTIADFGIFIDLDGIDGFVHRSDLTWDRNNNPGSVVEKGQPIKAKIISKNDEEKKVKLSVKALQEKPWDKFVKSYAENDEIDVKITNTLPFGAFAQIISGVEGLIHISEISYERIENVSDVLSAGDTVKVKIIGIDTDHEKISLSIKATLPRPELPERPSRRRGNDDERGGRRRERGERKSRDRNKQSRQRRGDRSVYNESAEFTLADSLSMDIDLYDSLGFNTPQEEEVPAEETVEITETVEPVEAIETEAVETETMEAAEEEIAETAEEVEAAVEETEAVEPEEEQVQVSESEETEE